MIATFSLVYLTIKSVRKNGFIYVFTCLLFSLKCHMYIGTKESLLQFETETILK